MGRGCGRFQSKTSRQKCVQRHQGTQKCPKHSPMRNKVYFAHLEAATSYSTPTGLPSTTPWGGWGEVPRESLMGRCAQRTRSAQIELSLRAHLGASRSVASSNRAQGINPGDSAAPVSSAIRTASAHQRNTGTGGGESCTHSDRYPRQSSSWTYIGTTVQFTRSARSMKVSRLVATSWKKSCRRVPLSHSVLHYVQAALQEAPGCARSNGGRFATSAVQPPRELSFSRSGPNATVADSCAQHPLKGGWGPSSSSIARTAKWAGSSTYRRALLASII